MAHRVLIVDDEPSIAQVLAEFVSDLATVEIASNGPAAITAALRTRPDVVLLDMNMPGMSGLDVLRHLSAIDASIPVILITATEDDTAIADALKAGAFSYIPKPFHGRYVQHLVSAALAKARPQG
jgi:DNA-binding response OmpR family regulator